MDTIRGVLTLDIATYEYVEPAVVIAIGGPRGCQCGRCETEERGMIIRCSGAQLAVVNEELAADGERRVGR